MLQCASSAVILTWTLVFVAQVALVHRAKAGDFHWTTSTPEVVGMSTPKLKTLSANLASQGTKALLVIRNDKIVHEWYSDGHGPDKRHFTASMAKALVGGVSLAIAVDDGLMTLDDRVATYVPQWKDDPLKSKITIRHLGSHTSGLDESKPKDQGGWQQAFWERREAPHDPFSMSRDQAGVLFEPGTQFRYSNPGIAMLGYAITAALKDTPEKDLRTLLRDRVMRPIGVADDAWSIGYGQTIEVNGLLLVGTWGGGNYTARAAARVGRLMLREGNWEGQQLISPEAVHLTTRDAGLPNGNGMGWWTNGEGLYDVLPRDAFWAAGAGHQTLLVIPSKNLICVRNGPPFAPRESEQYLTARGPFLFEPLMDAVIDQ